MLGWIKNWGIPVAVALVILLGLLVQVLANLKPVPEGSLGIPLERAIPSAIEGWKVTDLDLGATESVTQRSYDLLNLDDFVHREYRKNGTIFSVYVAYWEPGKMPVRLVNQHTPDRCWTEVGWTCTDREWDVAFEVKGMPLQPGQWGVYELNEFSQHTYFWHIVGGEVHWYGGKRINTRSSISSIWEDFKKFGLNVHREQFFVRVVSPYPMDDLWQEAAFLEVMEDLGELCLAVPSGIGEN